MEFAGLVGGALLGALAGELLKEVLKAKRTIKNFRLIFQRIESTLKSVIPQVDAIIALNCNLDIRQDKMEEFKVLVKNGISLILECSRTSRLSLPKKVTCGKKLLDLEKMLKEYFLILLPLDHFRNTLEVLNLVRDLHTKLGGETSSNGQAGDERAGDERASDSAYRKKVGTNLFLLKGYQNDLNLTDLFNCESENSCKGKYTTTYRYKTKFGNVILKSLTLDANMKNNEFRERMEEIGKIGKHPNIVLPFGYFCSDVQKFLLYEYVTTGSFEQHLKEPINVGTRPDWNRKLENILGIVKGINYMHSQCGVVHGNIKSSNIFLTRDLNCCISDFGLNATMHFPETKSPETFLGKLVPKCPAPELKLTKEATKKSDVYDFGVMLFEILSLYNYHLLWHPNVLIEQMKITQIASICANKDQEKRPKMDDVVKMIQKVISKEDI